MSDSVTFLQSVANVYVEKERDNLIDYCFVTPNKRTGAFLTRALSIASGHQSSVLPAVITISDFISDNTSSVEISNTELLFLLYEVYSDLIASRATEEMKQKGEHLVDFNTFQYWGNVLLNDFNDVDRYMVDAGSLFKNVKRLKEISSNYLTEEQIEILKDYWKEEDLPVPVKEFWNHVIYRSGRDKGPKRSSVKFIRLWQVAEELYERLNLILDQRNLAYPGKMYRQVANSIALMSAEYFPYRRYIFVGFNVLSASEQKIFEGLQRLGVADFYWDFVSPLFKNPAHTANRFLRRQIKQFPSQYSVTEVFSQFPNVTIVPVPSQLGQVKLVPEILQSLHPEIFNEAGAIKEKAEQKQLFDTAIVLPNESLCLPLLQSLPNELNNINVTMGFSVKNAPVYSLFRSIISMQLRARMLKFENTFFYEDVLSVVTHPLIRQAAPRQCDDIIAYINLRHLYNVPVSALSNEKYSQLSPIFKMVENNNDTNEVIDYLLQLVDWLRGLVERQHIQLEKIVEENLGSEESTSYSLEIGFLSYYRDSLIELKNLSARYLTGNRVFLNDKTVFHLVERIMGHKTIRFEGVPLKGLQLMGVLETRNLDFKNVVILSMNERIFPRRHYAKSMIPHAIRKAFSMSTIEHQESIYSYYFYRMISRAENVVLLYDGRNQGAKSGQPSRYINQIKFLFPQDKVRTRTLSYPFLPIVTPKDDVRKTQRVMDILKQFTIEGSGRKLSATSLNMYINCPLQFYLTYVEQFYEQDKIVDYMDMSTYGTIVHNTVQEIYQSELSRVGGSELVVTMDLLDRMMQEKNILYHLNRAVRKFYFRIEPDDESAPIYGSTAIMRDIMVKQLQMMFEKEKTLLPYSFVAAEAGSRNFRFKVTDDMEINMSFSIDRVDKIHSSDGTSFYRLIDYKTGGDKNNFQEIPRLFDPENKSRNKALFQLLLYTNAFAQWKGYNGKLQPMLYPLKGNYKFVPFQANKGKFVLDDYRQVNEEFMSHLKKLIEELLNPDISFAAHPSESHCGFCQFHELCGRAIKPFYAND